MKRILLASFALFLAISLNAQQTGTFKDPRDGKTYNTVKIGNQTWLAENLAYKPCSGNYWAYNDSSSLMEKYGYLYDWQTAMNVCPMDWHLPSDAEWTELTVYLGGESVAGGKLKAAGTTHWNSPNTRATNENGFTALPGGYRHYNDNFNDVGSYGYWWSATEGSARGAWGRSMYYDYSGVYRDNYDKEVGFSVRCVRD